jgi:hypothetical protein
MNFISSGSKARAIRWYITACQTEKQNRGDNVSALVAEQLAYHSNSDDHINDAQKQHRLLVF